MTYHIAFTSRARRDIARLPDRIALAVVEFCAGPLAEAPYRVGRPLVGELEGLYSARRGEYRVIYAVEEARVTVEVARIARRADVYR